MRFLTDWNLLFTSYFITMSYLNQRISLRRIVCPSRPLPLQANMLQLAIAPANTPQPANLTLTLQVFIIS